MANEAGDGIECNDQQGRTDSHMHRQPGDQHQRWDNQKAAADSEEC
jgi:hypothetical protein